MAQPPAASVQFDREHFRPLGATGAAESAATHVLRWRAVPSRLVPRSAAEHFTVAGAEHIRATALPTPSPLQIVTVFDKTVVTFTARLPWQCQDPLTFCRTSFYVVLNRPLPLPGLSLAASGWSPIRSSEFKIFRAAKSCQFASSLPRSYSPGVVISKRNLIGIDTDIWRDPLTNEVWLSWSSDDNVPMSAGLPVQAVGISKLDPATLEIACEANNLILPVR